MEIGIHQNNEMEGEVDENDEIEQLQKAIHKKGIELSDCMLSQSMFTIAGVGIGTALGVRTKSVRP